MDSNSELSTPFPLPPLFYKKYNEENWGKIAPHLVKYGVEISEKASSELTPAVEIKNLLPPSIPENCSEYMVFGRLYKLDEDFPTFEKLGITLLYTTPEEHDLVKELKGLNRLVLEQFIELVQHIVDVPANEEPDNDLDKRMDGLNRTLLNMLQMVNRLRPSQARATLHQILEKRRTHFQELAASAYKACSDILSKTKEFQNQISQSDSFEKVVSSVMAAPTPFPANSHDGVTNFSIKTASYVDDDPYLESLLNSVL